jgi:hypothetical protein
MTHAIKATTLNLSGTLTFASSLPLLPISIPLSILSAVHLTSKLFCCSFLCNCNRSTPKLGDELSHVTPLAWTLFSNANWVLLKLIKLDCELEKQEWHGEEAWRRDLAAMGEACCNRGGRYREKREYLSETH